MNTRVKENFRKIFSKQDDPTLYFAPGRINLIGEHTDYNGGHVFPAAISLGTYAAAIKRKDKKIRLYSMNFPNEGIIECTIENLDYNDRDGWANYPKGMIKYMNEAGYSLDTGLDILFYGNIPNGAGLSSSASIEMVTGVCIVDLFQGKMDRVEMVKIGQKVENQYIGVNSGIMDQFAIGMGKANHAIHLNTNTLDYKYAPIELPEHVIMIIHTNKQRNLHESKYNERRSECETALKELQRELYIKSLGDLSPEEFEQGKHLITNETVKKRAKHAVYENHRTIQALEWLEQGDLTGFGELMNASHVSLKEDYEVTGLELDTIAETAWKQPGVIGARMTGAGFGGCAIAIVEKKAIDTFKENVAKTYQEKTGLEAAFYDVSIGDRARKISE